MKIIDLIRSGHYYIHRARRRSSAHKFPAWMTAVAMASNREEQLEIILKNRGTEQMIQDHLSMSLIRLRASKR